MAEVKVILLVVLRVSVREEYRHPTSPQSKVLSVHATLPRC